jgi:hypothetical protein
LDSLENEIAQGYMLSFIKDQRTARFPVKEKRLAFIKNEILTVFSLDMGT